MSNQTKQITEISEAALKRIKKEKLSPVPDNYELWFVYYTGSNPDITRALDLLDRAGKGFTEEQCHELYKRFLSEDKQSEEVRKAGDQIQETIKGVSTAVSSVKNATSTYNQSLSSVAEKLNSDVSKDELQNMLKDVASNTKNMISQNQALEDQLVKSSAAMHELQRHLEVAQREALTDSLTNLANRKAFDAEIVRIAEEADEAGKTFSLVMMDIDHFKSFNDNYGHQVGDQVLRLVSKTLKDGVKGRDVAARYGGEEFAILLPDTPLEFAVKVSDSLRLAVANKEVVNRNSGETLGRITLSGGVSQYIPGENLNDLIERADTALYTAKHNGRNQIAAAPMPNASKKQETGS